MTGVPMSEKEMQEKQEEEAKDEKTERMDTSGLGVLFQEERERQGLDRRQIADVTRLRRFIIEALEKEEWERLPQPVFVRGFIRTYAQALSLDEKQVLELYEGSGAAQILEPKYLVESSRSGIWRVALLVFLLAFIGVAIFLYFIKPSLNLMKAPPKEERQSEVLLDKQIPSEKPVEKAENEKVAPDLEAGAPAEPETSESYAPEQGSLRVKDQPAVVAIEETAGDQPTIVAEEGATGVSSTVAPPTATEEYVLQATITERTWVRVYVDNEDPQEFIFQPGSNPQWKARKGFNLIVGNAAGITLDFNGKQVEDLGNMGQVIRLFLPTDFRSEKYED